MIQNFLRSVELFSDLHDDELAHVLMAGMLKRYRAGGPIVTEGAANGSLYVIRDGQVRVSKHVPGAGEEALTILGPGEIFGEVEFFDGSPASALMAPPSSRIDTASRLSAPTSRSAT